MTPEERNLVSELFDRLATLEDAQRDPEAERLIKDGLRQAPNAAYALVQTVLVQDEALKRASARIQELEAQLGIGAEPPQAAGFLDNMRDALFGRREASRPTSVPTVRPGDAPMGLPPGYSAGAQPPGYGAGAQPMPGPEPMRPGGSFLGTAAAAAAGVIGGSLLLDGIRSMTGHHHGAFGAIDPAGAATRDAATPWSNAAGGNLAHDAGLDDIGRSPGSRADTGEGRSQGLFDSPADAAGDNPNADVDQEMDDDQDLGDDGFDLGGDGGDGDGP
jgi:uncharacterized protein